MPMAEPTKPTKPASPVVQPTEPETTVPVISGGTIYDVPASQAESAISADPNSRLATDADLAAFEAKKKYGGGAGMVGAAGLGLARGATFGLSDVAGAELGGDSFRSYANAVDAANPLVSGGAEMAGMVAPMLIPGGQVGLLGKAGKVAGAIPRGAAAFGEGVGGLAARAVGTGAESVLGRGLQAGARTAAQFGAENALMEIGSELSDQALGDTGYHGEAIFQAGAAGFLGGAALGAPLGFVGGVLGKGVSRAADAVLPDAEKLREWKRDANARAIGFERYDMKQLRQGSVIDPETGEIIARGGSGKAGIERALQLGDTYEDLALGNATTKNKGELLDAVALKREVVGKQLGEQRAAIENLGVKFDQMGFQNRVGSEVLKELDKGITNEEIAAAKNVTEYMKRAFVELKQTPTFERAWELRKTLDETLRSNKVFTTEADVSKKALVKIRNIFENELENQAEKAATEKGLQFVDAYKANKRIFGNLQEIEKTVGRQTERELANRRTGVTDYIAGGTAASLGTNLGGAMGGIPGAAVGGTAGAILGSRINAFAKERFEYVAADVLKKAESLARVNNFGANLDKMVTKGVEKFINATARTSLELGNTFDRTKDKPKSRPVTPVAREDASKLAKGGASGSKRVVGGMSLKQYADVTATIRKMAADPTAITARLEKQLPGDVALHAPGVMAKTAGTANNVVQYLAAQLPKEPAARNIFQATKSRLPSDMEIAKFAAAYTAATNPLSILESAAAGKLNRQLVDHVAALYPSIFEMLKSALITNVGKRRKGMTTQQLTAISLITNTPVGPANQPDMVGTAQASHTDPEFTAGGDGGTMAPEIGDAGGDTSGGGGVGQTAQRAVDLSGLSSTWQGAEGSGHI